MTLTKIAAAVQNANRSHKFEVYTNESIHALNFLLLESVY